MDLSDISNWTTSVTDFLENRLLDVLKSVFLSSERVLLPMLVPCYTNESNKHNVQTLSLLASLNVLYLTEHWISFT